METPRRTASQPGEGGDQRLHPRLAKRQVQGGAPARAHGLPGDVQEALAQPLGLGERQFAFQELFGAGLQEGCGALAVALRPTGVSASAKN